MVNHSPEQNQAARNYVAATETKQAAGISPTEHMDGCWSTDTCPAITVARAEFRPVMNQDTLTAIQNDPIVSSATNEINYAFFVLERLAAWMSQQWTRNNLPHSCTVC